MGIKEIEPVYISLTTTGGGRDQGNGNGAKSMIDVEDMIFELDFSVTRKLRAMAPILDLSEKELETLENISGLVERCRRIVKKAESVLKKERYRPPIVLATCISCEGITGPDGVTCGEDRCRDSLIFALKDCEGEIRRIIGG